MQENTQQLELQKLQLVNGLTQAAESLRNAAAMAENFAAVLHTTSFSSSNALQHMNMFPNFAGSGLPQHLQQHLQQQGHSAAASQLSQQILQQLNQQNEAAAAQFQQQQQNPNQQVVVKKDEPVPRKRKRVSTAAGADGEKPERKKRIKDPNAPKRPPSAYLLFQNQVRKEMVKQHDGLPYHEVLGEIAKRWSIMTDEQKQIYNEATSKAKLQYEANKAAYELEKTAKEAPIISPVAVASSPEEAEDSDEEVSPVATNGAGHAHAAHAAAFSPAAADDDSEEEGDEEDDDEAEADVEAAAPATIAPPKLNAIPTHLQTPAQKKGAAVMFSSPAIEAIKTVQTPIPEKKEKKKREKKERK